MTDETPDDPQAREFEERLAQSVLWFEQGPFLREVNVVRLSVSNGCAIALRSVNGIRANTLIVGRGATYDEAAVEAVRRLACLDAVDDIDWDAP